MHVVCGTRCETCGVHALGLDPGFDLDVACMLIPCSMGAMRTYLKRHRDEFPKRYRRKGRSRWLRVLYGEEVLRIRRAMLRGHV